MHTESPIHLLRFFLSLVCLLFCLFYNVFNVILASFHIQNPTLNMFRDFYQKLIRKWLILAEVKSIQTSVGDLGRYRGVEFCKEEKKCWIGI